MTWSVPLPLSPWLNRKVSGIFSNVITINPYSHSITNGCGPSGPGVHTGVHYDVVYMGRGSKNLLTCWIPFGDYTLQSGPLAILAGSHSLPSFQRLRETYGRLDVDRDKATGWLSRDPLEVSKRYGGQWQAAEVRMGDVIILGMYTMHASLTNTSDSFRISCDTRWQPASEPADERWVGANPIGHSPHKDSIPIENFRNRLGCVK